MRPTRHNEASKFTAGRRRRPGYHGCLCLRDAIQSRQRALWYPIALLVAGKPEKKVSDELFSIRKAPRPGPSDAKFSCSTLNESR